MKAIRQFKQQINPNTLLILMPFGLLCATLIIAIDIKYVVGSNYLGINWATENGRFVHRFLNLITGAFAFTTGIALPICFSAKEEVVKDIMLFITALALLLSILGAFIFNPMPH